MEHVFMERIQHNSKISAYITAVRSIHQVNNPLQDHPVYMVGDMSGELLFKVNLPDNSLIQVTHAEMVNLGFDVALVTSNMAKLSFGTEVV